MCTPTQSLSRFVIEQNLQEVFVVWPTGCGKTNAGVSLAYDFFTLGQIEHVVVCTLKPSLKKNLRDELVKFFSNDQFHIYSMQKFFKDLKLGSSVLNKIVNSKRIVFLIDEIDQIIPRIDHSQQRKCEENVEELGEKQIFHWKFEYYDALKQLFNHGLCGLTRRLILMTATPFVNNLEKEILKYVDLTFRDTYENKIYENNSVKFLQSRMHSLPPEVVKQYFLCFPMFQQSEIINSELDFRTKYKPYRLYAGPNILQEYAKGTNDLSLLYPANNNENLKLANVINQLKKNVHERAFVMCYLKETQRRTIKALNDNHIKCMELNSDMNTTALYNHLTEFCTNNQYHVLVATEFLCSGFSIPNVVQIHIVEPFAMSEPTTTIQSIGRCIRVDSHTLSGVVVKIWLYVYDNIQKESKRYDTAIRKQIQFDNFNEQVRLQNESYFKANPLSEKLGSLRRKDIEMIDFLVSTCVKNKPTDKKLLFVSEDVKCDFETMCKLGVVMPVGRGVTHSLFGALVRTRDNLYDMSDCNYVYVLKDDDILLNNDRSIRAFVKSKLIGLSVDEEEDMILFSGINDPKFFRRHVVDKSVVQSVKENKKIKQNAIRGALIVKPEEFALKFGLNFDQYSELKKPNQKKKIVNDLYDYAVSHKLHLDFMDNDEVGLNCVI